MKSLVRLTCVPFLASLVAVGCQSSVEPQLPAPDDVDDTTMQPLVVGAARDLASSTPIELLAFKDSGPTFVAGHLTHAVSITGGVVALKPKHIDPRTGSTIEGEAFAFETAAIHSAGEFIDVDDLRDRRIATLNVAELVRGDIVETITNHDFGIEQAWQFASRPAGDGDLTVEVAAFGYDYVATTDSGLHFRSPKLGVKYSHATWVDANGQEFPIPVRYEEGRIVIEVSASVLDASAFPAVLDPTVTGELYTDAPVNGTVGANSRNQDVASNGSNFFAVWQDQRESRNDDIYGTTIDSSGTVLANVRITNAAGVQQNPAVAFVGSGYVVAWENVVSSGNSDIAAAFVTPAGVVTQLGTIAGTGANETLPAVAARGTQALLVWQDGANIRGAVFSGGSFGGAVTIAGGANVEKEPAVSGNAAGDYLVAYAETLAANNDNLRGVMVSAAGVAGAPFDIDISTGQQNAPAAAFNGTDHVVVWSSQSNIAGARVSAAGALVDAMPVAINTDPFAQQFPDVSCVSSSCLVTWQDARNAASVRDVYGAVVSSAMAVTANDLPLANAAQGQITPATAASGSEHYLTWTDNRDLEFLYARGARVSAGGAVDSNDVILARGAARLGWPSVTFTPLMTAVYFHRTLEDINISHVRFTSGGAQLDNPPKQVTGAPNAQLNPSSAYVGSNPIVVWQDTRGTTRDIYAARTNPNTGLSLDGDGFAVSTAAADQSAPAIASGGSSALVVWQDRRNGAANGFDIYGALVTSAGTVSLNDIAVCSAGGDQTSPRVAYDSVNNVYLVVWNEPDGASSNINGARVSAAGAVLDANCGVAISASAGSQFAPDVAYGGGRFMVVWEDRRNDANLGDIYGARVTATGSLAVLDPNGIAIAQVPGSVQNQPSVAFGTSYAGSYLVAWTDGRTPANSNDVYGAQVSVATGAVEPAFAIANTAASEASPELSAGPPPNPFSIVYTKSNAALGTTQIQFRRITLGTVSGQPCSTGTQCSSGFCADGVCCDTACGGSDRTDCQACSVRLGSSADGSCTFVAASVRLICRDYANRTDSPNCDVREYCDGTSAVCPPDLGANQGLTCTMMGGATGTCPPNSAAGAPHVCQ